MDDPLIPRIPLSLENELPELLVPLVTLIPLELVPLALDALPLEMLAVPLLLELLVVPLLLVPVSLLLVPFVPVVPLLLVPITPLLLVEELLPELPALTADTALLSVVAVLLILVAELLTMSFALAEELFAMVPLPVEMLELMSVLLFVDVLLELEDPLDPFVPPSDAPLRLSLNLSSAAKLISAVLF